MPGLPPSGVSLVWLNPQSWSLFVFRKIDGIRWVAVLFLLNFIQFYNFTEQSDPLRQRK